MGQGFPCGSVCKEPTCNAGDLSSIPGLGRSLGKVKATHSSILAWRIPGLYSPRNCKESALLSKFYFRLITAFLPRSKHLSISRPQSPSAVILEPPKIKSHCLHFFPIYLPWSDGIGCHDLHFWNVEFKPAFLLSSFTFINGLFISSSLSAKRVVSTASNVIDIPPSNPDSSLCFIQPGI